MTGSNIKPCPNLFEFNIFDKSKRVMLPQKKRVMCSKTRGHSGKCRVLNPNDGCWYDVQGAEEFLPEDYFKAQ